MSRPTSQVIKCQKCGIPQEITMWGSMNVTLNPELRDQLIEGSLTRFVCKECGYSVPMVYPMLYHDMNRKFMIWLWPGEGSPDSKQLPLDELGNDYRLRVVPSPNRLLEKISIFEKQFDDRFI